MGTVRDAIKRFYARISPVYRSIRRVEERLEAICSRLDAQTEWQEAIFWYAQAEPGKLLSQTKRDFFRKLSPAEGVLRKLQLGSSYLLRNLDEICRENGITCWISFGTLLGAARHGGFIPWDDDVDVSLLRDGFEQLQMILEKSEQFALRPYFNEEGDFYLHKMVFRDCPELFWVDITVWDYADTHILGSEKTWQKITTVRERTYREISKAASRFEQRYHSEQLSPDDAAVLQAIFAENRAALPNVRKADAIYRSLDSVYLGGETLLDLRDVFPLSQLTFEGRSYPVPSQYERYLTEIYHYLDFPRSFIPGHRPGTISEERVDKCLSDLNLGETLYPMFESDQLQK